MAGTSAARAGASLSSGAHQYIWPIALIGMIGLFLVVKLRAGLDWDGDDALYVMNAQNILNGLPYAHTPYLFNAANAINPASYPPGLPLLFAPVIHFLGVDFAALRMECLVAFLLFLAVLWGLARRIAGPLPAALIVAAMGLQPFVVESSNTPASEFPFLLFSYSSLLLFERLQSGNQDLPRSSVRWVLAALAMAGAYLTRSVGLLLFPAALASALPRGKSTVVSTLLMLAVAAVLCFAVQLIYRADVGTYVHYFDQFHAHDLVVNLLQYRHVTDGMLGTGRFGRWLCRLLLLIGAVGYLSRLRAFSILESFFVLYLGLLLVYPISLEPARYEMPIWPLLFIYCAQGFAVIARQVSRRVENPAGALLAASLLWLYVGQLRQLDYGPIPYSVTAPQSSQLFAAVRSLPPGARILTRKPTILALYTQHGASIWPEHFTDAGLEDYMRRLNIDYIVQDVPHLGVNPRAVDELDPFIARNRSSMDLTFSNGWFNVYHMHSASGPTALSLRDAADSAAN